MYALATHSVAAASTDAGHIGLAVLAVLPLLAYATLVICALISIIASPQEFGMKIVWAVLVFIAPFIGSLLWFFIGRGHARRTVAH